VVGASLNFYLLGGGGELGVANHGNAQGGIGNIFGSGAGDYGDYPTTPGALSVNVTSDVLGDYSNSYTSAAWAFAGMAADGAGFTIAGGSGVNDGFIPYLELDTIGGAPEPSSWLLLGAGLVALGAARRRKSG
jgi:hypothetical protein